MICKGCDPFPRDSSRTSTRRSGSSQERPRQQERSVLRERPRQQERSVLRERPRQQERSVLRERTPPRERTSSRYG